ncbi:putative ribonuclease H-like domain-containing protein [Tanacetum coccineum]|uniref:Ribonuclease H-like domain-containing protein n=1 Tax=Tanacetum coccineum TaxID=301880 RepID=A0ABQ5BER4_9ASTR
MATSSSSIASKLKSPTSSPSTNGYLNLPISPPPRVPPPPPTQESEPMDITLTLLPITPLDIQFSTPSPLMPSPPLFGHPIPWNLLEAYGATCLCCDSSLDPQVKEKNTSYHQVKKYYSLVGVHVTHCFIVQDGICGYDWSYQAEEGPTDFALMAHLSSGSSSSSSLNTKVQNFSKECLESYQSLQKQFDQQREVLTVYEEDIAFLKYNVKVRDNSITELKNQLAEALREKDDLKLKLKKFETSSMKLTKLINSQISVNNKSGVSFDNQMNENELHDCHLNKSKVFESASNSSVNEIEEENNQVNDRFKKVEGYHAVPPPYTRNYMPSRPDLSFARLDDSVYKTNVSETISSVPRNESTTSKSSKDSLEQPKDVRPSAPIIEEQAKNLRKSQSPRVDKINWNGIMTQKLWDGFEFNKKACFVCGSLNHLIKDYNVYENKMVGKSVLNNMGRVTGQREVRPVWNNAQGVHHQNKLTRRHPKRNFVPAVVATKSGLVPVNAAKQISPRAAASISTARHVNTAALKQKVNATSPTKYSYFKAHSPLRRTFLPKSAAKINNFNKKVYTTKVNMLYLLGLEVVVSTTEGKRENAIKSSACWIWRPTRKVIDHISKDSGSYMPKRFDYGNPQYALEDQGIFDSGCFRHMTRNKSYLTNYQDIDGGFELKFNLFSVSQMCDKKNSVLFTETECLVLSPDFKLLDESQVLLKVPRQNNMYSFDLKNVVPSGGLTCLFAKATIDESNLWHRRLGHINFKTMNKLVRGNLVRGLPSKLFENDHTCVACQKGKQHKASCKTKLVSSISQPLQMLHMDLFGPTFVRSINHKIYCLVVTDDYSRFSWVFFLATKDETSGILKTFITGIENQINHKVKIIRCDNGTEFKNNDMNQFCGMKGIKREFSVARTPQQNGVAERKNRTLIEAARTMLADSLLPTTFWAEAVNTACYVQNRVLVTKPHNKTPYELLLGRPPSISFMRPFGCPVTILNTLDPLGKFDGKADEGFLVGYSINNKAFRVFNTRTRKVEENLHINFLENKPNVAGSGPEWLFDIDSLTKSMNYEPVTVGNQTNGDVGKETNVNAGQAGQEKASDHEYILLPLMLSNSPLSSSSQSTDNKDADEVPGKGDDDLSERNEGYANNTNRVSTVSAAGQGFDNGDDQERIDSSTQDVNTAGPSINTVSENINTGSSNINTASPIPNDPSMQSLEATGIFDDAYDDREEVGAEADLNNLETTMNVSSIPTTRIHKDHPIEQIIGDLHSAPLTRRMSQQNLEELGLVSYIKKQRRTNHKDYQNCLFACFLSQIEPKKVIQALTDPSWIEAMQEELLQFKLQKVWTLVDLPKGKRAIGTKWVYRNKKDERGIIVRNKARLVAQGYTQEEGIDYDEVFAPVARIEAIRLFLAYASFMGLIVYQMDVKSAFLYGTIEEEVYVCQPPGFEDPQFPDKVYKVEKALYGLHQAPRAWYETLSTYLLENGYRRGTIDKTLFIKKDRDDAQEIQMSSMGELTFFLRLKVQQKEDGIFISQDKYVAGILKKFDFTTVKAASTPIETNKALNKDEEAEDVDVHLYRSMIGSLMYLTASRPDIMFVVCACARFQVTPKTSHLHAVKRIFRYLKGQPKLGLWYPRDSPFDLEAFSDSDYARASLDRKSITGGCQFLSKRLISWQCKKQTIVANSTTEAEYVAAANCVGCVFMDSYNQKGFDYGFNFMNTKIHIDNESTICIVKNLVFHSKTKHIEIRHHFIRDSYEKKLVLTLVLLALDYLISEALFEGSQSLFYNHINFKRLKNLGKPKGPLRYLSLVDLFTLLHMRLSIKEWKDIMERAATTASSLEVEQDSAKQSNDLPLSSVNTLGSGEDNMELMELMEHCTKLSELNPNLTSLHQMANLDFCDKHNMVAYLQKSEGKLFWQTTSASTLENGDMEITATIDGKVKVVFEASIRRHLKLEDSDGISTLPTSENFEQLALMGAPSTSQPPTLPPFMHTTHVTEEAATMPHDSRLLRVYSLRSDEGSMTLNELMVLCTTLSKKVETLESDLKQTKLTYGATYTKLIMKVKKLEHKGRHEHDFEFIAPEEDYTVELNISTANVPVSTAELDISTAIPEVKTAAESLVYIRRSAAKRKDKGKAIMKESLNMF